MIHYVLQVKFATGKIKQVVRVIVAHLGMMHCIQCLLSTGVVKEFLGGCKVLSSGRPRAMTISISPVKGKETGTSLAHKPGLIASCHRWLYTLMQLGT